MNHRIGRRAGRDILLLGALALGALSCDRAVDRQGPSAEAERPAAPATPPPFAPAPPVPALPSALDVSALAERVNPVVVNITTTQESPRAGRSFMEFFHPFGPPGGRGEGPTTRRVGLGSGFIIDAAGYVVTNAHVVEDAAEVNVRLADDRELDAKVVGRDPKLDLALLKLDGASDLPVAALGSSEGLRVGEPVIAIGNPFGLGHTVTTGIVSAKARAIGLGPYDDFIQTDASINPGNSGGPLFNFRGEVVGINTAIRAGATGIGFAIPVDALKDVLPQLREKGYVERGKLGIGIQEVTPNLAQALGLDGPKGALVARVEANSAAGRAGIREGDVITAVEGTPIVHAGDLPRTIARHAPGERVRVTVARDGDTRAVTATLDKLEDEIAAAPPEDPSKREPGLPDGKIGLRIANAPDGQGVLIAGIEPGAEVGDMQPGDILYEVAGKPVRTIEDLRAAVAAQKPGSTVLAKVRRGDISRFTTMQIPSR